MELYPIQTEQSIREINLYTPEMTALFAEAPIYRKDVKVVAVQVTEREEVRTILADGTEETVNFAEPGDYIVANTGGERHVVKSDLFPDFYRETEEEGVFESKGLVRAIRSTADEPVQVRTDWGIQFGGRGCMFAVTYDPNKPDEIGEDRRIIGGQEFENAYVLVELASAQLVA